MTKKTLKYIFSAWKSILLIAFAFSLFSCASTKKTEVQTAETIYDKAMEKFKKEDWEEATQLFDVIKLQYPASVYADDAQYYLAEINYKKGEYILAAFNYNMLRRLYPTSEFNKQSLYKAGMSYYQLSPDFDRDQEYTLKSINSFMDYQTVYHNDSLYQQAGKYIDELRNKLGKRAYTTAELYVKLEGYKSAIVYLDAVIDDYPDTKFFEPACLMKVDLLIKLKKYDEAQSFIDFYKRKFPEGPNIKTITDNELMLKSMKK